MRKKQQRKPPVWVAIILDESGSMQECKAQTISGFNEYVQDRVDDSEDMEVLLWVTKFNTQKSIMWDGQAPEFIEEMDSKTYTPRGGTALLDAVGSTILRIEGNMIVEGAEGKYAPKIIVVIMTDGEENCSKYFTSDKIAQLIKDKEEEGNWTFVFMGANQDSWASSKKIGIRQSNSINYHSCMMDKAMKGMSNVSRSIAYGDKLQSLNTFEIGGTVAMVAEDLADAKVDLRSGTITIKTTTK